MSSSMSKASTFWPGQYSARLAKALEDEDEDGAVENTSHNESIAGRPESSKSIPTERVGALHDKDERQGSRRGKESSNEPDRPMKVVDSSSRKLRRPQNLANRGSLKQVRKEPFTSLSKREEERGRYRKAERKTNARLVKRRLIRDIEVLKREVEDLQQMVAQQASLSDRRKGKRVRFHEDPSSSN